MKGFTRFGFARLRREGYGCVGSRVRDVYDYGRLDEVIGSRLSYALKNSSMAIFFLCGDTWRVLLLRRRQFSFTLDGLQGFSSMTPLAFGVPEQELGWVLKILDT